MLTPLFLHLMLAQAPQIPPQGPAATAAVETPQGGAAEAPQPSPSALAGQPQAARSRVDKAKPYMRVWYWPPSPGHAADGAPAAASYSGVGDYTGGPIDPVRFPTNRNRVLDEEREIQGVAAWLKAHPGAQVHLDGYADPRGSARRNKTLSQARAEAVKQRFLDEGIEASRITVNGHGAAQPVSGETSDEGWWLSRRVTIRVVQ